jgi:hypothetical protein
MSYKKNKNISPITEFIIGLAQNKIYSFGCEEQKAYNDNHQFRRIVKCSDGDFYEIYFNQSIYDNKDLEVKSRGFLHCLKKKNILLSIIENGNEFLPKKNSNIEEFIIGAKVIFGNSSRETQKQRAYS